MTLTAPAGVVLVIRADSADDAYTAALGAIRGGIDAVEITLTVPDALSAIDRLRTEDIPLGAGTVLEADSVDLAIASGAQFIVSPETNPQVIARSLKREVAVLPGAMTPTEVQHAYRLGATAVKLFPAGALGGPEYLTDLRGPLPHIPFVISGGVTTDTAAAYFAAGAIAVCVGRTILDQEAIARGDIETISRNTREFMSAVRG